MEKANWRWKAHACGPSKIRFKLLDVTLVYTFASLA